MRPAGRRTVHGATCDYLDMDWPRVAFNVDRYVQEVTSRRQCFICHMVESDSPTHEVVFRDEHHIVFLNRYPTLEGYVLVAPLDHREQVVSDFSLDEYLRLQALLYQVGQGMAHVLPTERLYVLSLGSQQGNSHVHWHVASLPPGVEYQDQQFAALMGEHRGYLDIPVEERRRFALRLRDAMAGYA